MAKCWVENVAILDLTTSPKLPARLNLLDNIRGLTSWLVVVQYIVQYLIFEIGGFSCKLYLIQPYGQT